MLEHDVAGEGEPPLVLLPGGFSGWHSFLLLVPELSAGRRVVRVQPIPNREGMAGRVGDGSYDADLERESLELTLARAGVDEMHLLGWSNGGRIALDLALADPRRVRTLTMIEPAAWWLVAEEDESARRFDEFISGCGGRECGEEEVRAFLVGAGVADPDTDFTALPQWEFWLSCSQVLSWYGKEAQRSAEAGIAGFESLDVPTLLVRGRATAPWLHRVVDVLAAEMPNTEVVELDGGHACLLESSPDFLAAVGRHIDAAG